MVFVFVFLAAEKRQRDGTLEARILLVFKASFLLLTFQVKFFVRDFCEVEFWEVLHLKKVQGFL